MKRAINLTAAVLLIGLLFAPAPAQAGWNSVLRYFGEFWSDGYHSKGDPWNKPAHHAPAMSTYRPYYPAPPTPAIEEQVPTPAKHKVVILNGQTPVLIRDEPN